MPSGRSASTASWPGTSTRAARRSTTTTSGHPTPCSTELAYPTPAIVVTSGDDTDDLSCDSIHCSLREAIDAANSQLGADVIAFDIPGGGIRTITPGSALPDIDESVLIDGSTQPGTFASPVVVLDGSSAGPGVPGLSASGDDVTIRGLRITGFDGAGVAASGSGLRVDSSTIDHNGGDGIAPTGFSSDASISGNRILANGGLGIDDGDNGPSFFGPTAPPSLMLSQFSDQLSGSISGSSGTYAVEVFKVASCDPSGYGEGDVPIGGKDVIVPPGFPSFASWTFDVPGGVALTDVFTATVTNPDGTTTEFSNCASKPKPNLSLTIDDDREVVGVGEAVHYTLSVTNATQINASNIVLQHTLPAGATFGQAIPTSGTCTQAAGVVTCQLGSLQSFGQPATVTVEVDVRLGSAGVASTSATVSATQPETTLADNTASDTTTVAAATPATYTVTSNNDVNDGTCNAAHCSLREAISAANANPGRDTILFNLTGSKLIQPSSPGLPIIGGPVVIDATSNPGFAGQPVVVLSGTNAFGYGGLHLAGGDSEVRGIVFNSWYLSGVSLERWGGNTVAGNWFGLDASGTIRTPNSSSAIGVFTSSNVVGGSTAADRNVISGSSSGISMGFYYAGAPEPHDNVVRGNWIGLNAAGTAVISNTTGIAFTGDNHLIRDNIVVGSGQDGILVSADASLGFAATGNVIQGNVVGLDPTGTTAMPNQTGVRVHLNSRNTVVGGTAPGEGNTIAGNQFDGINVFNGPQDTVIAGNRIGTAPDGTTSKPNGRHGIILEAGSSPRTTIGGTAAGAGNVIAFNAFDGVSLMADGAAVLGNSIHDNGGLGIDRSPTTQASNTVTNTPASLSFPVLTAAVTQNGLSTVTGTVAASASTTYRIELFGNATCDPRRERRGSDAAHRVHRHDQRERGGLLQRRAAVARCQRDGHHRDFDVDRGRRPVVRVLGLPHEWPAAARHDIGERRDRLHHDDRPRERRRDADRSHRDERDRACIRGDAGRRHDHRAGDLRHAARQLRVLRLRGGDHGARCVAGGAARPRVHRRRDGHSGRRDRGLDRRVPERDARPRVHGGGCERNAGSMCLPAADAQRGIAPGRHPADRSNLPGEHVERRPVVRTAASAPVHLHRVLRAGEQPPDRQPRELRQGHPGQVRARRRQGPPGPRLGFTDLAEDHVRHGGAARRDRGDRHARVERPELRRRQPAPTRTCGRPTRRGRGHAAS